MFWSMLLGAAAYLASIFWIFVDLPIAAAVLLPLGLFGVVLLAGIVCADLVSRPFLGYYLAPCTVGGFSFRSPWREVRGKQPKLARRYLRSLCEEVTLWWLERDAKGPGAYTEPVRRSATAQYLEVYELQRAILSYSQRPRVSAATMDGMLAEELWLHDPKTVAEYHEHREVELRRIENPDGEAATTAELPATALGRRIAQALRRETLPTPQEEVSEL
jgi:hypothetical protein